MNWFHVTDTWTASKLLVQPRVIRSDSNDKRDKAPCIAVTPSPAQCILALGEWRDYSKLRVYRTTSVATRADWVFDVAFTNEYRIYKAAQFKFVREIDVASLARKVPHFISSGTSDEKLLATMSAHLKALIYAL